jgi:RHS repeat-associated protein
MLITVSGDVPRTDSYYYQQCGNLYDFWTCHTNGPLQTTYVGDTAAHDSTPGGGYTVATHYLTSAWKQDSAIVDGAGHTTTILYTDTTHFGGPIQVTDALGHMVAKYHYDLASRIDTASAPANGSMVPTVTTYDQLDRATAVKDPLGHVTQYVFGPTVLTHVIDPKGQVYKFDQNALGAIVAQHDLTDSTKADSLKYDMAGRLRTIRTRRGDTITMTYDALGRLLTRAGPDFPTDSFRYDPAGLWTVATNANAYDSTVFDAAGRPMFTMEKLTGGSTYSLTYHTDVQGRVVWRSAPTGGDSAAYHYDGLTGAIQLIRGAGEQAVLGQVDGDNIPHAVSYGVTTGEWTQGDTTNADHLTSASTFVGIYPGFANAAKLDSEFAYRWSQDSLGRLVSQTPYGSTNGVGGQEYLYDALGQVVVACTFQPPPIGSAPPCLDEYGQQVVIGYNTYAYDAAGNRTDPLAQPTVGLGNRTTKFKGYALGYDPNGSLVSKRGTGGGWGSDTTLFTWDALGRLTRVEKWPAGGAHAVVTYAYDAQGRRVAKRVNGIVERYVHDGDQVIMDVDTAGALKAEYAYEGGVDDPLLIRTPAWTAAVIKDPQIGTVRGLATAEWGNTVKLFSRATYWGEVTPDTGVVVRIRMASREYDQEVGLYYNRARYYDPQLGRFLSEDPAGIGGGLNLYAYAGNDPVNGRDPNGLCWGHYVGTDPDGTIHYECPPDTASNDNYMRLLYEEYCSIHDDCSGFLTQQGNVSGDDVVAQPEAPPIRREGPSCGAQLRDLAIAAVGDIAAVAGIGEVAKIGVVGGRMLLEGGARLIVSEAGQGVRQVVANVALKSAARLGGVVAGNGERAVLFAGGYASNEVLGELNNTAAINAKEGYEFSFWDLVPGVSTGKAIWNYVQCRKGV